MTTTALATAYPFRTPQSPYSIPLSEVWRLAQSVAKSGLYTKGQHAIFVTMLAGLEMGLSPMKALGVVQMAQGRPSMSADSLVGLVKASPHCLYFMMIESTREYAVYETRRPNDPSPTRYTCTAEDAQHAGLTTKGVWKRHSASMLRTLCASSLARLVYPDITMGIDDEEEGNLYEGTPEVLPVVSLHPPSEDKQPVLITREELGRVKTEVGRGTPKEEEPLSFNDNTKRFILEDLYKKADTEDSVEKLRALVKSAQKAAKENILTPEQLSAFIEHCKKHAAELKKAEPNPATNHSTRVQHKIIEIEAARDASALEDLRLWFEGIELTPEEKAEVTSAFHLAEARYM
jgi:hypothetical protein